MCYYKDNDFVPNSDIYMPIQCGKAFTKLELGISGDGTGTVSYTHLRAHET